MTELQKAIIAYRKTWKQGKEGGTIKSLATLLGKSPRTINYWLYGKRTWEDRCTNKPKKYTNYAAIIREETERRRYSSNII